MPFFEYQSQVFHYTDQGQGCPLVCLHGFCERASIWEAWTQAFLPRFRVLTLDLWGFGASPPCPNWRMEDQAQALGAFIEQKIGQACHILGHSMGGYLALALAEVQPNCVKSLGLLHSHAFADDAITQLKRDKTQDLIKEIGPEAFAQYFLPQLFSPKFRSRESAYVHRWVREQAWGLNVLGLSSALQAMRARRDRQEVLKMGPWPLFLLLGEQDPFIAWERGLSLANLAPCTRLELLPETGHLGFCEQKEWTQVAYLQFIQGIEPNCLR